MKAAMSLKALLREEFVFSAIGVCESVFVNKRGVPRQGVLAPTTRARIKLFRGLSGASVEGLESFSHLWIVFVFSRNNNKEKVEAWRESNKVEGEVIFPAKVKAPLLKGGSTGLFATRSPHRPNPIGLTLARVVSVDVEQMEVVVSGVDICHGTPVLDLKPFVPGDIPRGDPEFAPWVLSEQGIDWNVSFAPGVNAELQTCIQEKVPMFYEDLNDLKAAIVDVLHLDVRAVHHGRGKEEVAEIQQGPEHQCVVDRVQVFFSLDTGKRDIVVISAREYPYCAEALAANKTLDESSQAFHEGEGADNEIESS